MNKLDEFLNGRSMTIENGKLCWVEADLMFLELVHVTTPFTEEEIFKFLTYSTQAYRESLH